MLFTCEATRRLLDLVEERKESLFPDSRTKGADDIRNKTWQTITDIINVEFPDGPRRSAKQVRSKFTDVKKYGKQDLQDKKRHSTETGGGPPKDRNMICEKVQDMFEGTPSFDGLACGLETSIADFDSPENTSSTSRNGVETAYTPVAKRMKTEEPHRKTIEQLQLEVLQQQLEVMRQQKELNEQLSQIMSQFSEVLHQISASLPMLRFYRRSAEFDKENVEEEN